MRERKGKKQEKKNKQKRTRALEHERFCFASDTDLN